MNSEKLTKNSIEVIQNAQSKAMSFGNPEITEEHIFSALIERDKLTESLLKKLGVNTVSLKSEVENIIEKFPRQNGGNTYINAKLNEALIEAENQAKIMTDEYISVEHI